MTGTLPTSNTTGVSQFLRFSLILVGSRETQSAQVPHETRRSQGAGTLTDAIPAAVAA
jgi:hypothetical protein